MATRRGFISGQRGAALLGPIAPGESALLKKPFQVDRVAVRVPPGSSMSADQVAQAFRAAGYDTERGPPAREIAGSLRSSSRRDFQADEPTVILRGLTELNNLDVPPRLHRALVLDTGQDDGIRAVVGGIRDNVTIAQSEVGTIQDPREPEDSDPDEREQLKNDPERGDPAPETNLTGVQPGDSVTPVNQRGGSSSSSSDQAGNTDSSTSSDGERTQPRGGQDGGLAAFGGGAALLVAAAAVYLYSQRGA
jgi:hypothetical protein